MLFAIVLFISQNAYAVEYDKWVEWDENDTTVPTEQITTDNSIAVSVSPEGEMWTYLFIPKTTGPYIFYSDDEREDLDVMGPMGRVRAVDPQTGALEYIYELEKSGFNRNHFTVRFNAVKGRKYYLDTILKHPQSNTQTYKIKLKADKYSSITYRPARRIEYLYTSDGTIDYSNGMSDMGIGGFLSDSSFFIAQGEFEYTRTDGTKEIYKYRYNDNCRSGEFVCNGKELILGQDWAIVGGETSDKPWGPGKHEVTIYEEGKPFTVTVWIVTKLSDYTESWDYYTFDDGADDSGTSAETTHKVSGNTYKPLSKNTVAFVKAKNTKTVTVPATVKFGKVTWKVTRVNANAFKGRKIRIVKIGKNVKEIKKNAFKGSGVTKLILKTKLLKKTKIKNALKGSKVKTIQVMLGTKKLNKKYIKIYKKYFIKKIVGKKVKVK